MKQGQFTLEQTRPLASGVYELALSGDTSAITAPGQFVNIALPGRFLRRPISVCDWRENRLLLLVKRAGEGTGELVSLPAGTKLDVLSGLGNGFDPGLAGAHPILAGGGIGIAPLYGLARRLLERGAAPAVALGFPTAGSAFYLEEFSALGCPVRAATQDGSLGERGFVTTLLEGAGDWDYVFACGPLPMLKAVHSLPRAGDGQFSLEARMACGFGACMGCAIPTRHGPRRVCREGPVFHKEEILW